MSWKYVQYENGKYRTVESGGDTIWGSISGTLSEQTDLATALNGKADKVSGATNGNLAGLDGNGNLTDSGIDGDMTTTSVTGNPLSFTTDSEQAARSCVITLEPIQAGSGDPSPSNVRVISGRDSVKVICCGFNIWDEQWEVGSINSAGVNLNNSTDRIRTKYILIAPNTDYFINIDKVIRICEYDHNKTFTTLLTLTSSGDGYAFRSSEKGAYIRVAFQSTYGTTYNNDICINISKTEGSPKNGDYVAYTSLTDFTLILPETVYGCTLDVESGELTVTRERIDMGDLTWNYGSGSQVFSASISDKKDGDAHFVCEIYKDGGTVGYAVGNKEIAWNNGANYKKTAFVKDTDYSTKETFTTAVTGKYLVYDLAEPYTIQLTPAQVRLLQGSNVVTSNGTSIALTYRNGEVASLADVSSVAESVNALAEQSKTKIIASAVGDGIKTYKNLLDELYPYYLKLSKDEKARSYIEDSNGYVFVSHSSFDSAGRYTYISGGSGSLELRVFLIRDNNSMANKYTIETSGNSITNLSSNTPSSIFYLKVK